MSYSNASLRPELLQRLAPGRPIGVMGPRHLPEDKSKFWATHMHGSVKVFSLARRD